MDINQMTCFLDVAQTQHMTKSAQRLHMAQPAVSRSIARLEDELGVDLFERSGRGIRLTGEGRLLQERLIPVMAELEDIQQTFADIRLGRDHEVRISLQAGSHIASKALEGWVARNPAARITLMQMSHEDEEVDIDVGTAILENAARYRSYSERVMLVAPESMSFKSDPVKLSELEHLGFISLPSAAGFGRFVSDMCANEGFQPNVVLESDNPSVVREMIGMGLGVGFWPEKSWGPATGRKIAVHSLAGNARRWLAVSLTHKGASNAQAVACFQHICRTFDSMFG